jgi:hypothetical protein
LDDAERKRLASESQGVRDLASVIHGLVCRLPHHKQTGTCDWVITDWDEPGEQRTNYLTISRQLIADKGILPAQLQNTINWSRTVAQVTDTAIYD